MEDQDQVIVTSGPVSLSIAWFEKGNNLHIGARVNSIKFNFKALKSIENTLTIIKISKN